MSSRLIAVFIWLLLISSCSRSVVDGEMVATHNGWTQAQALGGRTPVAQATDLSMTAASVTLSWNAMTVPSYSVSSYNIYRGTSVGGENFVEPFATGIPVTSLT